jgi:transposase
MPPTPDGAPLALSSIRLAYPWLRQVFADGGYAGPKLEQALAGQVDWTVEIVKRANATNGFALIARRWVVERTLAWLGSVAASPKTSKPRSRALSHGSLSPISGA